MSTLNGSLSLQEIGAAVANLRTHDASAPAGPDPAALAHPGFPAHAVRAHPAVCVATDVGDSADPIPVQPNGLTIDALSPDVLFFRPFKKFELTRYEPRPGEPIDLTQLMDAAERGDFALEDGDVAILDFGWDRFLPGGADAREPDWCTRNQPGLTDDACGYLATAGTVAVASDTPACDISVVDGTIVSAAGHSRYFLPNGIVIVEGLRGLAAIPPTGLFVALPLKLAKATTSPLRVLLLTDY